MSYPDLEIINLKRVIRQQTITIEDLRREIEHQQYEIIDLKDKLEMKEIECHQVTENLAEIAQYNQELETALAEACLMSKEDLSEQKTP